MRPIFPAYYSIIIDICNFSFKPAMVVGHDESQR